MRVDAVSKLQAKTKRATLTKKNTGQFIKLTNRRDIRGGVVNKLRKILEEGDHFETPLMTNLKGGKHRLLDGNHRMEAIQKYLDKFPQRKVEVAVFYYEDLTEEEEKKMYTKWNLGTKQSINDFVKQYWDSVPILARIKKDPQFPWGITPTWSTKGIEFKLLMQAYLTIDNKNFNGGSSWSAIDFIDRCKKLNELDHIRLKSFLKDYIDIFGLPDKRNMHYKKSIFSAMMRIWLDNYKTVGYSAMRTAMLKVRGHERVVYYSSISGSREIVRQCYIDLLTVINGKRRKNLFV